MVSTCHRFRQVQIEFLDTTTHVRKINGNSMDGLGKTRGNHILDVRKMVLKRRGSGEKYIFPRRENCNEQRTNRGK